MRSGSRPRQQMPPTERSRSMWRAMAASLPIAATLILLPAIAFASPPDRLWIAGIYDGADGDDLVTLVYETAASHPAVLAYVAPLPCLSDLPPERIVRGFSVGGLTPGPRAPPPLCSPVSAHVFTSLLHDRPPPRVAEDPATHASIIEFRLLRCRNPDVLTRGQVLPWRAMTVVLARCDRRCSRAPGMTERRCSVSALHGP